MIGRTLNHYKIVSELGSGGMGEVYLAEDTKLHRQVALKVLASSVADDAERRARFEREARAVAALNHPNIVTIHSVEEAEGLHFITMELVRGKTLSELIPAGGLALDKLFQLAIPLADAVSAAHQKGITHRDLKPANVMLNEDGRLKILDFGLAKLREEPSSTAAETQLPTQSVTQEGHILGTVAYMSPEQAEGKAVDHRSDIFSLGIILFEMATGQRPFRGDTKISLISSILKDDPPSLTDMGRVLPRHLARIVGHCLQKDPSRRLQSTLDLRNELEGLKEEVASGTSAVSSAAGPVAGPEGPLRRPWLRLVGLGLVIAAVAYGAYHSRGWLQTAGDVRGAPAAASAQDNSLAVLYFENLADPEDVSRMERMTPSLLITALSQSPDLKVVSRQRLHDILNQLGRDSSDVVDRSIGSEVARKAGVRWIVTGEILQMEPSLVLTAEVAEAGSGSILASHRVIGQADEDVFSVVDRLSAELRRGLAPSRGGAVLELPLSGVTTSSPDAYRHYLDGLDYYYKWYMAEAKTSFEKAVELDPTFAMAHYWLSITPATLEPEKQMALAMEHLDRVGEKDKHFIRSWNARLQGHYNDAIRELNAIVEADPDDKEAHYRLGRISWIDLWNAEDGIRHLSRVIELDPQHKAAWNVLAYAYNALGDRERSEQAIHRYLALAPDEANPFDSRGELYTMNGQLELAAQAFEQSLRIYPGASGSMGSLGHVKLWMGEYSEAGRLFRAMTVAGDETIQSWGRLGLASIQLHQGKLDQALEILDQGIAATKRSGLRSDPGSEAHIFRAQIFEAQQDLARALAEVEAAVDAFDLGHRPNAHRPYLAYLLAKNGDLARAEAVLGEVRAEVAAMDGIFQWQYEEAAGLLEWVRGDLPEAAKHLEAAETRIRPVLPALAAIYLEMGQLGEAVAAYETISSDYYWGVDSPIDVIQGIYHLGVAYEKSGWTKKAIAQYEAFLEKWKDADPDIVEVEDARLRLARLKGTD